MKKDAWILSFIKAMRAPGAFHCVPLHDAQKTFFIFTRMLWKKTVFSRSILLLLFRPVWVALKPWQAKGISSLQGLMFCVRIIAFSQLNVKWTYCIIQRDSPSHQEIAPYQLLKTGKFYQLKGIPCSDLWGCLFSMPAVPLHSQVRWLSERKVDDFVLGVLTQKWGLYHCGK